MHNKTKTDTEHISQSLLSAKILVCVFIYDHKHNDHKPQTNQRIHFADNLTAYWLNFQNFLSSVDFFHNHCFRKQYFRNIIRVLNSLDPDQVRLIVGPDLGPNCLQKLLADSTSRLIG